MPVRTLKQYNVCICWIAHPQTVAINNLKTPQVKLSWIYPIRDSPVFVDIVASECGTHVTRLGRLGQ